MPPASVEAAAQQASTNDLTDTVSLLLTRRSQAIANLTDAGPDAKDLRIILTAAARVPDHGKLAPWRYIVFKGDRRAAFGAYLEQRLRASRPDAGELMFEKARTTFTEAPVVIGVVSRAAPHVKIPEWEQYLSAGASCMNIVIAATALGYGVQWVTGWYAYDREVASHLGLADHERMAGFIFIGGMGERPTDRARPDLAALVSEY
ncbi:nitroreductase family protein [Rhodoligotrophos defluvii]|uniref:nitroreductase family protein n=1 Tax=Rhodoligotrophos defluvii TaxID=2561934 RepID=UPI0010C95D63|nr:nitroreductase [Rhodoligotrophos defluvii]